MKKIKENNLNRPKLKQKIGKNIFKPQKNQNKNVWKFLNEQKIKTKNFLRKFEVKS